MMEPIKVISDSNAEDVPLVHSLDRSLTYNEVNMTVTVSENCEDNVSYPGSSSTASDDCAPATQTGEVPKQSGSPIMRGLQNMLSIFRSSQSPIVAGQSEEEVCTPEIDTSRVSGSGSIEYPIVASTPVPNSRKDDSSSKRSSPLKESVIFNDELSNELRWNNDSTILFSKERIPIHKLFLSQTLTTSSGSNNSTNKTDEVMQSTLNQYLNTSSEPMDVSFNESIVNNQNTAQTNELLNNINNNDNITTGIKTKNNLNISLEPMDVSYNDSFVNKTYAQQINDMPSLSETRLLNETNNNSVFLECETSLYVDQNETELLRSFNDSINTYRSPQDSVVEVVQEPVKIKAKINETEIKSQSDTDSKKKELINQINVGHNEMNNTTYWENLDVSNIGNMNDSMEIFLDATTNLDTDECENNYENESTIKKSSSVSELNNTESTIDTENIPSGIFINKLHDSVSEEINNIVKTAEAQVEAKLIQEKSFINSSCQKQHIEDDIKTRLVEFKPNDLYNVENVNNDSYQNGNDLGKINVDVATISTESTDIYNHIEKDKHLECDTGDNVEIKLNRNSSYQEVIIHNDILTKSLCKETVDTINNSNVVSGTLENKEDNILDNTLSKNEIFKTISNEEKIESINGINIKVDYETLILNKKSDIEVTNMNNHNIHQINAIRPENTTIDIKFDHTELVSNENINDITSIIKKGNENINIHEKEIQTEKSPTNECNKNIEVSNEINSKTESISIYNIITENYVDTDKAIHDKIDKLNVDLILNKSSITIANVENINIKSEIIENLTNGEIITNNMIDNIKAENVNETDLILNEMSQSIQENDNVDLQNVILIKNESHENKTSNNIAMTKTILENIENINEQTENLTKRQSLENNTSIQINNDLLKNKDLVLNKISRNIIDNESNDLTFGNLTNSQHNISHENLKSCMNDTITVIQNDYSRTDDLICNKNQTDEISLESMTTPFATKMKLRMSPPNSSIQKEHENDLNFDDLQNPFATKSKIHSSPPPTPNMYKNISIDTITEAVIDNECIKKDIINKDIYNIINVDEGDKYHEAINSSLEINCNVEIKNNISEEVINTNKVIIEQNDQNGLSLEQSVYCETSQDDITGEINNRNKDILIENKLSITNLPKDFMDNKLSNVTINVNMNEDTEIISNGCEIDSPSDVNTEDEDTLEGPFLDDNDFIDLVSDNEIKMDNVFNSVNQPQYENFEPEEMFIDAAAYDFLMNKNGNIIDDNGKESLFLKFDPLCAKKVTPDGIASALLNIPDKLKSSNNINVLESENDINYDAASEESFDDLNVTVAQKPTMAVMPAVNNEAAGRQQVTPTRPSRQSFGSPAIALIDRLLTISANNTPIRNNRTITHDMNYEQDEANKALTELKQLLSNREQDIENLRSESHELKSKLTFLENQMKNLETINNAKLTKINELNEKLESTTKKNKNMVNVVEEFERTIASLMSEIEQEKKQHEQERFKLINERDEQTAHLASMEVSFSDLHSKYEKSKQVILGFKANEDSYKKSLSQFEENLQKMQNTYELLKQHATGKLNRANEELEKINRTHESEVLKMNTMIKRKELHITSLEETLNQKVKANEELTAICDELINKVG